MVWFSDSPFLERDEIVPKPRNSVAQPRHPTLHSLPGLGLSEPHPLPEAPAVQTGSEPEAALVK